MMRYAMHRLYTGPVIALLMFASMALAAQSASAQVAGPNCSDRGTILNQLAARHNEQPANMGLANNGTVMEVLVSDEGTWTVILTSPQGVSCMVAAGQYWEPVERKKVDFTPSSLTKRH